MSAVLGLCQFKVSLQCLQSGTGIDEVCSAAHTDGFNRSEFDAASQMHKFLLVQVRDQDDPILGQEVECFSNSLQCDPAQITVFDLLSGCPTSPYLSGFDVILLGGSGDYSVAEGGDWLPPALQAMRELYDLGIPTFASCWGFQAMAAALGGEVITDMSRAELGTVEVCLTDQGQADPLFGCLESCFLAPMGHQDCVVKLPPNAIRMASSSKVQNQAFKIADKPIYGTQFHPELNRLTLIERVKSYPQYVEAITGDTIDVFVEKCGVTDLQKLLQKFVQSI